jgi:hypothetical protein
MVELTDLRPLTEIYTKIRSLPQALPPIVGWAKALLILR